MRRLNVQGARRAALFGLAGCALLAALLGAGYAWLTGSDGGREYLARRIERALNQSVQGSLEVDRIDRIDLPEVEAHGVRIVAPDGVPAIDVEHAIVEVDLAELWHGRLVFRHADLRGGIVRVTEDERGRVNMEETFRGRAHPAEQTGDRPRKAHGSLDLRGLSTRDMTLAIFGGSLPHLVMRDLHGMMRIRELEDGRVNLRFDDYRGEFVKGLPTGRLDFHDVKGHVDTDLKRLLRFEGRGLSEGEPVAFELDIFTEPETHVRIDADFPRLSSESLATLAFAGYTRFTPHLELHVRPGRLAPER